MEEELRLILGQLETFTAKVNAVLQQADFSIRREIIRSLVKRVEVDEQQILVVFRVSPTCLPPLQRKPPTSGNIVGGLFWRPIYHVLEDQFELILANAHEIKALPGRKTDVRDCEWIAERYAAWLNPTQFHSR